MSDKPEKTGTVTLAQVAEVAGVSKMTASRVLRNASGFSPKTRERVMSAVDALGYVPNRLAAAFGSDKSSTLVGVCVPRLTGGMFGSVVDAIDHALSRFGYQTMIGSHEHAPDAEEAWLKSLLSWRPAGVILTGRRHTTDAIEMIRAHAIPVVEIWTLNTSPLDVSVGFNPHDCGYEMGRYMIGRGRRKIAYVGAEANSPGAGALRMRGLQEALETAGHPLVAQEILVDKPGFYAGYYGTEVVLNRNADIDAIYYQDDAMAVGGLFYCQAKGLNTPADIGIAGWGGMEVASVLPQRLTTTHVATEALGKASAEALIARLRGEPCADVMIIPTRLVPGATV